MAKRMYFGGAIVPMTGENDGPGALVTEGEQILYTGSVEEARRLYPGAEELDLKGTALLPAFLDGHSHLAAAAATMGLCNLSAAGDFGEILAMLKAYERERDLPPGKWLLAFGYDHTALDEGTHPDRVLLDEAFPDRPVLITHVSGHMGVLNSAGLKALGVHEGDKDPEGGRLVRDEEGRLTGLLEETAFFSVSAGVAAAAFDPIQGVREAVELYLQNGVTAIQEGFAKKRELALLEQAEEMGALPVPVYAYLDATAPWPEEVWRPRTGPLRIKGYKIFLDGSPQGRTAWLTRPYEGEEEYKGYPAYEDGEVFDFVKKACLEGRQLIAHANGDAAIDQFLGAVRRASEEGLNPRAIRPIIIHAQLMRADQLKSAAELSVIPSFFIAHVGRWGEVHAKNLGDRAETISPAGTAERLGIPFNFHQDTPVLPPDIMDTVYRAVCRKTAAGRVLGPKERVSPYAALKAVTANAAYGYFEEKKRGTLAPGLSAEFVLLDKNPLTADPEELGKIRVLAALSGDGLLYRAPGLDRGLAEGLERFKIPWKHPKK